MGQQAIWEPAVTLASKYLPSHPMRKASMPSTAEIPEENGRRYLQSKEQGPERKPIPLDNDRSDYAGEGQASSLLPWGTIHSPHTLGGRARDPALGSV